MLTAEVTVKAALVGFLVMLILGASAGAAARLLLLTDPAAAQPPPPASAPLDPDEPALALIFPGHSPLLAWQTSRR